MKRRLEVLLHQIVHQARSVGTAGLVGAALLLIAVLAYGAMVVPLYDKIASLNDEVAEARARITGHLSPAATRTAELSSFYSFFPKSQSSPLWLGKIYGAAKETGVTLTSGEYEFQRTKESRLGRYRISLPAHGSYEQVREFIAAVLKEVPAAALDDISLRREAIESTDLEARLRLTLYMEAGQ
ncbi:MAG TPA: hypothetical protein VIQ28_06470 [Burkholderiales bacterium]|jgi:hypothetical protein